MSQELWPLLAGILTTAGVLLAFVGLWQMGNAADPVETRLKEYGGAVIGMSSAGDSGEKKARGKGWFSRQLKGKSIAIRIADQLSRADLPLTVAEYILVVLVIAAIAGLIGFWRGGLLIGGPLAIAGLFLPQFYVRGRANKRRQTFTNQLPDVLTLLVGALRAGYAMMQAMDMLIDRMPQPSSTEFARAMRAVSLGMPLTRALGDMADRVGSEDLYLVVTAMNVQQELGGNLSQILETITTTIRERIKIKREIQVFTSQQRMTGYMLAGLPIAVVVALMFINPGYISKLTEPGIMRFVLAGAVGMQILGFIVIQKIISIEV
jgi:tight adherence protein B